MLLANQADIVYWSRITVCPVLINEFSVFCVSRRGAAPATEPAVGVHGQNADPVGTRAAERRLDRKGTSRKL